MLIQELLVATLFDAVLLRTGSASAIQPIRFAGGLIVTGMDGAAQNNGGDKRKAKVV
jgi:hypothetical protein